MTATRRPLQSPQRPTSLALDPEHVTRFGPYAETYRPQPARTPPPYALAPQGPRVPWPQPPPLPEADVTVLAANGNTLPAVTPPEASAHVSEPTVIVPMQRSPLMKMQALTEDVGPSAKSETIDVTLRRETATFSVPVSEAQLPQSLHAALARAQAARTEPVTTTDLSATTVSQPMVRDDILPALADTQFTEQDLALIGRMAPQAAE